ncbi:MAG: SecD/SecF family protein translocase subunit [Ruminococcus sp.]|nr:SecD/SecF family protein translocase subunit [Ruminococcus sp.]MBQ7133400.1 SecD/SecF family protein translocase subunit [Ruminococcus sp.]
MKRIPKPVFFICAILILLFAASSIFGVAYYEGDVEKTVIKGIDDIRWGIDIRGGVEATFKPADDYDATDEQLDSAKSIIETRMVSNGITDYELYADYGSDRIIVRFPWKEDETDFDPVKAIDELAATAKLTFRNEAGEVLMDGSSVAKAQAGVNTETGSAGQYMILLDLTSEGADIFAEATKANLGKPIGIYMDETLLSSPVVDKDNPNGITGGSASITGDFTAEEATKLANQINGGALPFSLEVASYSSISPTLGQNSLVAMAYAGVIALILIALFMIIRYRIPGVVAVIALLGQVGLSVAAITRFFPVFDSFTMTLPGIAGIILSIGMGVDANIITAERIKDEFKTGKTLDGAIEKGTKNSLAAIIDGNMTVVIVSIILLLVFGPSNILSWLFGASTTGTIYAFGYTLLMGVISNFVMGVFFSRVMLKSIAGFKCLRKNWLFGGAK